MKKIHYTIAFTLAFWITAFVATAQLPLKLPALLSDNAVLQKSATVKLWGKGPASFDLKIIASWNLKDTIQLQIPASSTWETLLQTPDLTTPQSIQFICGQESKTISNILLGDVWLCAGQSNMEMNHNWGYDKNDSLYSLTYNNDIRFFEVEKNYDDLPQSEIKGKWVICDTATAKTFSSVAYFFGKQVNKVTHHPIGLIGSYWGGTNIQTWMPAESFLDEPLKSTVSFIEPYGWAPKGVASLYNAMIYPLHRYSVNGVLWYQGEANVDWNWNEYSLLLSEMVKSWRRIFNQPLPFFAVQIAPWNGYGKNRSAVLREQIRNASAIIPQYESIDIADLVPDIKDIHPIKKREVGLRLANQALLKVYGKTSINTIGPSVINTEISKKGILLTCKTVGPLKSSMNNIPGFLLAGSDGVFYEATARIISKEKILVSSKKVTKPIYVRYSFDNESVSTIFDDTGLPLQQFRSDNFIIE